MICYDQLQYISLLEPLVLRLTTGPSPALHTNYASVDVNPLICPLVQGRHSSCRFAERHPHWPLTPLSVTLEKFLRTTWQLTIHTCHFVLASFIPFCYTQLLPLSYSGNSSGWGGSDFVCKTLMALSNKNRRQLIAVKMPHKCFLFRTLLKWHIHSTSSVKAGRH